MSARFALLCCAAATSLATPADAAAGVAEVGQLVLAIAENWESSTGELQRFERTPDGWRAVSGAVPVLLGAQGLAWGRGVSAITRPGPAKAEGDGRAPAGTFKIGKILGYAHALPDGADFPYHRVTKADAWIDDPGHPLYNRHVVVDPKDPPAWFEKQRMRLNDPAYAWMIEIRHNADPPLPGAGSAIFIHIRRGPGRKTAGCTSMAEEDLLPIVRWLRAEKEPHYVLLPRAEYLELWREWDLPPPATSGLFTN